MASRSDQTKKRDRPIDWDKFGLVTPNNASGQIGHSYGTDGHQPTDANELFAGEQVNNPIFKTFLIF